MEIPLKDARAKLVKHYCALLDVRTGIEDSNGAEPVFRGTKIKVYQIAALVEGLGLEKTLADYPKLRHRQTVRSLNYALAYPKKGRPYPQRSLKNVLSNRAAAGTFTPGDDSRS